MPQIPIQGTVLDGLHHVRGLDGGASSEVGDGARDFQDAVVGAGAELEIRHGVAEELLPGAVELAVLLDLAVGHLGVGARLAG